MPNVQLFGRGSLDPLTVSYIQRAGISNGLEIAAVNAFVLGLRANSLLTLFSGGAIWLCSPTSIGASYFNLVSSSFTLSATAAPSHSTTGWAFDGVTQFLKTGLASNALGINSNTIGFYSRTNNTSSIVIGGFVGTTQSHFFRPRTATDLISCTAYTNATGLTTGASTDSTGYWFFSNTGTQARNVRRNGVAIQTDTTTIVVGTQPNIEFYISARNNASTADSFSSRALAGVWIAPSALTTGQCDTFYTLFSTYNSNVIAGGR